LFRGWEKVFARKQGGKDEKFSVDKGKKPPPPTLGVKFFDLNEQLITS
jgi:hypothetical protein